MPPAEPRYPTPPTPVNPKPTPQEPSSSEPRSVAPPITIAKSETGTVVSRDTTIADDGRILIRHPKAARAAFTSVEASAGELGRARSFNASGELGQGSGGSSDVVRLPADL